MLEPENRTFSLMDFTLREAIIGSVRRTVASAESEQGCSALSRSSMPPAAPAVAELAPRGTGGGGKWL